MLTLHRAATAAALADGVAELLAEPLDDPFAVEVVAVPAKGVERWLGQRLAGKLGAGPVAGDGVVANVLFPTPSRLVEEVVAAAGGFTREDDPWAPNRVLWHLVRVIDESVDEPWAAVLAKHLGRGRSDHRIGRRYGTAAHVADLFRRYGAERPALLRDWAGMRFTDGLGNPLPPDQLWQAHLWLTLRDRIGSPSPAERLDDVCARVRTSPDLLDLPARLSVFGATRMTTEQLAVLHALGEGRDVHLWLPHPSPAMWEALAGSPPALQRAGDDSALRVTHPLLASLARDIRELQQRIGADATVEHPVTAWPDTLLGTIQRDLAMDRAPRGDAEQDESVVIHACHGPSRQVEVLRESLLRLFADDPTLEPRDVLVMCPDVETFAPLVRAAFGQGVLEHPGHRLRVSLADRAVRQTNPLLALLASLLTLADGRVTASQLLDLASTGPVRRKFGFADEDLERLREWAAVAGARWGISPRQRVAYGLGDFPQNTFATALDRILLGVAADETALGWLERALPLDDVESNDIDLAGRFAEFVDRTDVVLRDLSGARPTSDWVAALTRALDLLAEVGRGDAWQLGQARREVAAAAEHGGDVVLRLSDVRVMLGNRLAGRPTRANFRTGDLTVATLVPMRSVPHRVVVLLGMDDEVYPRGAGTDGDDVLARNPCVGERDPRSEDRQLLLDAVSSASEKLIVLYSGADPVSGAARPPAVPIGELIDTVAATIGHEFEQRRNPLQNFDRRDFDARGPFSFDRQALAGARASDADSQPPLPFLTTELPPALETDVGLADLVAFLRHPIQAFLWQRLRFRVPDREEDAADTLSAELGGLETWAIGDRLLRARLAGADLAELCQAEWRRGTLPPFELGRSVIDDVARTVESLVAVCAKESEPRTIDVVVDIGAGRRVIGTIGDVYGHELVATSYSRLKAQDRLAAWAKLLAVSAALPGNWRAVTTGRGWRRSLSRSTLVAPADPVAVLRDLVELRDLGLREPLPIATSASAKYAEKRYSGTVADAVEAAEAAWTDRYGDHTDRHIAYLLGTSPSFAEFTARDAGQGSEPTRFGELAVQLWHPLLAAETVGQL